MSGGKKDPVRITADITTAGARACKLLNISVEQFRSAADIPRPPPPPVFPFFPPFDYLFRWKKGDDTFPTV